jgi:ATP-dependent protease HslVU (ClpYQ) peptidase subunit
MEAAITTLLAYHQDGRGYLAADRRCMAGSEIITDSVTKIVRAGKWLIGSTGSSLARNLVEIHVEPLSLACTLWDLACVLKSCFRDSGWEGEPGEKCEARRIDSSFLVASPDECGIIFSNFSPQAQDRPCPGGSGGAYAAGAFIGAKASWENTHHPLDFFPVKVYMENAIRVACLYDHNSGGLPQVEMTE